MSSSVSFTSVSELPEEERWLPSRCRTLKGSFTVLGLRYAFSRQTHGTFDSPKIASGLWQFQLQIVPEDDASTTCTLGLFLNMSGISDLGKGYSPIHDYEVTVLAGERLLRRFAFGKESWTPENDGWGTDQLLSSAAILNSAALREKDSIRIEYIIRQYPPDAVSSPKAGILPSLALACRELFDDEGTADVCFLVHRGKDAGSSPRQIYAHSKILASRSEYFAAIFRPGFKEGTTNEGDIALSDSQPEYSSDSDAFDTDEDEIPDQDHGDRYSSMGNSRQSDSYNTDLRKGTPPTAQTISSERFETLNSVKSESSSESAVDLRVGDRRRRVINVVDASYRTYRAFLFFLYAGGFALVPPRSLFRAKRETVLSENGTTLMIRSRFNAENWLLHTPFDDQYPIPWSSAKSMYRLCNRLGEKIVMQAAAEKIMASITPENAMEEWASAFSRQYPSIRKQQADYIVANWPKVSRAQTFDYAIKKSITKESTKELTSLLQRLPANTE